MGSGPPGGGAGEGGIWGQKETEVKMVADMSPLGTEVGLGGDSAVSKLGKALCLEHPGGSR